MNETNEKMFRETAKNNETNTQLHLNEELDKETQQGNKTRTEISAISGLKQNLLPKNPKKLPKIESRYAMSRRKLKGPNDFFLMYKDEFDQGYKNLFSPIKILFAKTKEKKKQIIKSNSNLILPGFKVKKPIDIEEEEEKMKLREIERKRKISLLEKCLKDLEGKPK